MNAQAYLSWQAYLAQLDRALTRWVSVQERKDIINWYTEYFEDAGPEREQEILRQLGSPEDLARQLAEERGYASKPKAGPSRKQICIAALVVVILSLPIYFLFHPLQVREPSSAGSVQYVQVGPEPDNVDQPSVDYGESAIQVYEDSRVAVDIPEGDIVLDRGETLDVSATLDGEPVEIGYSVDGQGVSVYGYDDWQYVSGDGHFVLHITIPVRWNLSDIFLNTSDGNITLLDTEATLIELTTETGDILAQTVKTGMLSVRTDVGNVRVTDITADSVIASVSTGNILATGQTADYMEFYTEVGDITVELLNGLDAVNYELSSGMGNVYLDTVKLGDDLSQNLEFSQQVLTAYSSVGDVKVFTYPTGLDSTL